MKATKSSEGLVSRREYLKTTRKATNEQSLPTQMGKGRGDLYIESEPKTKSSRRNIVLASFALEALRQHRTRQQEARRLAGDLWEDHDYVFCTAVGTHLNPGHGVLVQLKLLLKKAGLPDIRFHDLSGAFAKFRPLLKAQQEPVFAENGDGVVFPKPRDAYEHSSTSLLLRRLRPLLARFGNGVL